MEIDINSLMTAARDGIWNVIFGSMGVCVFALFVSRIELMFQRMALKPTTIAYQGPRLGRGLMLMVIAALGLAASLAYVQSHMGGAGLSESFSKARASTVTMDQLLVAIVAATAVFFNIGAFIYLMAEQRTHA